MNQLEYTLLVNDINNNYKVPQIEKVIRTQLDACRNMLRGTYEEKLNLNYKVLTLALRTFTERSKRVLPDFIYYRYDDISNRVSLVLPKLGYTKMLDILEFHTTFKVQSNSDLTVPYHNMIENKPLHFELHMNSYNSSFDACSISARTRVHTLTRTLRNKLVLSPNTPSTVLDKELSEATAQHLPNNTPELLASMDEDRIRLEHQLLALEQCRQLIINKDK